jgi:hypothetical protein
MQTHNSHKTLMVVIADPSAILDLKALIKQPYLRQHKER